MRRMFDEEFMMLLMFW